MNGNLEQQYGYLWKRKNDGWVLLKAPDLPSGYSVFNKLTHTALLIESDEVNMAVCERMKNAGCEVLENFPAMQTIVAHVKPSAPSERH
jgi:hypothetical protein